MVYHDDIVDALRAAFPGCSKEASEYLAAFDVGMLPRDENLVLLEGFDSGRVNILGFHMLCTEMAKLNKP